MSISLFISAYGCQFIVYYFQSILYTMIYSRQRRNNFGWKIDVNRPAPDEVFYSDRENDNIYYTRGYNTFISWETQTDMPRAREEQKGLGLVTQSSRERELQFLRQMGNTQESSGGGISDVYASAPANYVRNAYGKMVSSNPNWRPGFPGEKHLLSKKGLTYNYCGPGTHLAERLARGDPGLDADGLDNICKMHDIDYADATSWSQVREADNLFIDRVESSSLPRLQKTAMKGLMRAKTIGEDLHIIDRDEFTEMNIPSQKGKSDISGKGVAPNVIRMHNKRKDPIAKLRKRFQKVMNNDKIAKIG